MLIYNNKVYTVGTMNPGAAVDLAAVFKPQQLNVEGALLTSGLSRAFSSTHQARGTLNSIAREMLFEASGTSKGTTGNTSLRYLDETWRVGNKDEAILLGCLAPVQGQAEDVTRNPTSVTRLWLGKLPGGGESRPSLAGNLKQDTYVRVFIPVRPAR